MTLDREEEEEEYAKSSLSHELSTVYTDTDPKLRPCSLQGLADVLNKTANAIATQRYRNATLSQRQTPHRSLVATRA